MRNVTLADGTTRTRLETWGEIASHLGVEVRTAQRWERRMGIPIRRLEGGQAVFAFVDELDAWLDKKQVPPVISDDRVPLRETEAPQPVVPSTPRVAPPVPLPPPQARPAAHEAPRAPVDLHQAARLSRAWAWVVGVAVIGGLLLVATTFLSDESKERTPRRLVLDGPTIIAMDFADAVLWRHEFPKLTRPIDSVSRPDLLSWWERMDADGDAVDDLIVVVRHPQHDTDLNETLHVFTLEGQLKYSYTPHQEMVFAERSFSGPYMFWDIEPVREDRSIWVAFVHAPWWASGVVRIDGRGDASLRFSQPGLVRTLRSHTIAHRVTVLAGGVNNEYGAATLAVLDVAGAPASAPQKGTGGYTCLNCPAGEPVSYLAIPPSPLSVADGRPYNEVFNIRILAGGLEVTTYETDIGRIVFNLAPDLTPVSAIPTDGYWAWKPKFDPNWRGRTGHPSQALIRRWEQGSWSDHPVPVAGAS